jgi:hypothetical protein
MFVVDTSGLVLPGSAKVARSTHQLFTEAVRTALPDMRFVPAEVAGRKVRQLVQQAFVFAVAGSETSAARKADVAGSMGSPDPRSVWQLAPVMITVPK